MSNFPCIVPQASSNAWNRQECFQVEAVVSHFPSQMCLKKSFADLHHQPRAWVQVVCCGVPLTQALESLKSIRNPHFIIYRCNPKLISFYRPWLNNCGCRIAAGTIPRTRTTELKQAECNKGEMEVAQFLCTEMMPACKNVNAVK